MTTWPVPALAIRAVSAPTSALRIVRYLDAVQDHLAAMPPSLALRAMTHLGDRHGLMLLLGILDMEAGYKVGRRDAVDDRAPKLSPRERKRRRKAQQAGRKRARA